MKSMKRAAQAGFTLIELIVVIVILGILAATALPKFVSFGSDARAASVNAVKGSMASTASMVKGRWTVDGKGATTVTVEGNAVNIAAASGYPSADSTFIAAAGLSSNDYTTVAGNSTGTGTTTSPAVPTGSIGIVPFGISGTAASVSCFALYTPPTTATGTFTATATTSSC
jgi:MSHA pilin protein MshA